MANSLITDLLGSLPEAPVQAVLIGSHWTAVVVQVAGGRRCGLATSLRPAGDHHHGAGHAIPDAGRLHLKSGRELAQLVHSSSPPEVSVGMATINALLPWQPQAWVDLNAQDIIIQHGADKHVALI